MIWLGIVLLLLIGILLSAFFSGIETGFYRATRVRLLLDGLGGDPISRGLLWLTNNPALFVATTLIGNNLANFLTSLAAVLGVNQLFGSHSHSHVPELLAPMVLAPVIFVYGELLPKNLFYYAPNQLLRRSGLPFLFCSVLFSPVSALLWGMGRCLRWLLGEAPERVQLSLARKELARVLAEGQEAGILSPAQRQLAQGLFAVANLPVTRFCLPPARVATVRLGTKKSAVLRLARRYRMAAIPVEEGKNRQRKLVGYLRVADLCVSDAKTIEQVRPLMEISHTDSHIAALIRLQSEREMLARVVDPQGETVGLITAGRLTKPLFRGA